MDNYKLTKTERLIISNQNRLLGFLDPESSEYFNKKAEIAEYGYAGLYYQLFESIYDGISLEICDETFDILTMFRSIHFSIEDLSEDQKNNLNLDNLKFEGFDLNNDPHYGFMEFLIKKDDRYHEFKDLYRNSHSMTTLQKYRRMLKIKESIGENVYNYSFDDLKKFEEVS